MKTQIQPIGPLIDGFIFDVSADQIPSTAMSGGQNIFIEDGFVKKKKGYSQKGAILDGAITGSDQFFEFSGSSFLLVTTPTNVFVWNATTEQWNILSDNTLLENCDDVWAGGSGDTIASDTTLKVNGSASAKVTLVAPRTADAQLQSEDVGAIDATGSDHISFWLRSSIAIPAGDLSIVVSEDNIATGPISGVEGTDYVRCTTDAALAIDTWTFFSIAKTLTNLNAVINVSLYADDTITSGAVIYVDDIRATTELTATDADITSFDNFKQLVETEPWWIMTNGVDVIKKYVGGSTMADLGGSPPLAKHVVEFKSHLLLLDVTTGGDRDPQLIRWCNTGDAENWSTGNQGQVRLTGSDWIQGAVKFRGNYLAVLKERSVWLGYATGDSAIFQFDRKTAGKGCIAPYSIDVIDEAVIFLGQDDVYLFNGVQLAPIADKIRTELFSDLNPAQLDRVFGVTVEEQKEYWLFYPSGTSTYCDKAWVYNYEKNIWTRHTYPDNMTNFGHYQLDNTVTFDNLPGTFDSRAGRFDNSSFLASSPTTLLGSQAGEVFEYDATLSTENGTTIDGYFDTKDFNFTAMTQRQRVTRIDVSYTGNGLEIWYSTDKGASWTQATTLTSSTTFGRKQVSIRTSEDWIRFRFRDRTASGAFDFNRAGIHWQIGGRI
jgi:hypothetical protein